MLELLAIGAGAAIIRSIIKNRNQAQDDDSNQSYETNCDGFYSEPTTGGEYQTTLHDYGAE